MWRYEFRLDQDLESDGDWWLPGAPFPRVPGKLSFSTSTGINLELGISLIPQPELRPSAPQIVHGEIDHDVPVTLFGAVSGFAFLVGPRNPPVTAEAMLIGGHAVSTDDQIDQINLRIDGLRDWISDGSFKPTYGNEQPANTKDFDVHFSVRDRADASFCVETIPADISFEFEYEQRGAGHSVTLVEDYIASIRFRNSKSIDEAVTVATDLELLITLLTGSPATIQEFCLGPRTNLVSEIKSLIYHRTRNARRKRLYHRGFMPANYDWIASDLSDVFDRWFALCKNLRSVLGLLSTSLFQVISSTSEADFLTMAQAIEAYCRIRSRETYLPTDKFVEVSTSLINCIPSDMDSRIRNALKTKIGYMNEYSLKDRLKSLVEKQPWLESVVSFVEEAQERPADVRRIIRSIVDTRNNLTHVDQGRVREVPVGLVFRLQNMLCLSILNDIGINVEHRLSEVGEFRPHWWMNLPEH